MRVLIAFICLFLSSSIYAQTRKGYINAQSNTQAVEKYFRDNILLLDPIEGAYSVEQVTKGWNNYKTFPDMVDNYYEIIVKNGSKFICLGNPSTSFERIGDTNVYNCKFKLNSPDGDLWFSQRVVLQNGALFAISKTMPIPGNVVGAKYKLTMTFIKDYPTASIYEEALESEIQRRQQELDKKAEPTDWSGSGFALNNGYICTNYHVVEGAKSIEILGVQGDFTLSYSAKIVVTDKFNDLALLQIDDSKFKGFGTIPYKVKTSMAEVGENIFVLGYPLTTTMGDEIKLTTGVVSSRTGYQGDVSLYQISAPIQPGNSGGPLFDSQGNLIGIVSAKHTGAENVGYAIKASYLRNLMESSLTEDVLPTNNSVSSQPLTGKVKKIKDFVYFIKCSSKPNGSSVNNNQDTSSYSDKDGMTHYSSNTFSYRTKAKTCRIDEVVSTPENLKITFTYMNPYSSGSCRIHPDTKIEYISEEGNKAVKYMEECVNIPKYPERHNMTFREKLTFTLLFPPMPMNTKSFNILEPGDSDWLFYDIVLK